MISVRRHGVLNEKQAGSSKGYFYKKQIQIWRSNQQISLMSQKALLDTVTPRLKTHKPILFRCNTTVFVSIEKIMTITKELKVWNTYPR
ncbi:hypothetical protein HYD53_02780 [Mycoplasmopsis bovis]|nr:hypothetical protein [Mycoplasmopsis bovis]QQH72106.1 hypothetical protein HYD53_02780 [Mycoplasmopsis bovis]